MPLHTPLEKLAPGGPMYLPDGAGWLTRFKVALRAMFVLADNKEDGVAAPVLNASLDGDKFQRLAEELAQTAHGRELLRERPNLTSETIDLAALQALPEGTLGNALAQYYFDNGIRPFESPYPVRNDVEYLAKRYREIHDIVHLITGYGTDALSEMELQAFILGNIGFRQAVLILSFAAILRTDGLPPVWTYADKLRAAYRRGQRSKDVVLSPRYERYWSTPLAEVQASVGVASL
jgi:ubiquinone biosynthesis protein COQ4